MEEDVGKDRVHLGASRPDLLLQSPAAGGQGEHLPQDLVTLRAALRADVQAMLDAQKDLLIEFLASAHVHRPYHDASLTSLSTTLAGTVSAGMPSGYEQFEDFASAQGDGSSGAASLAEDECDRSVAEGTFAETAKQAEQVAVVVEATPCVNTMDQNVSRSEEVLLDKARLLGADAATMQVDELTPPREVPVEDILTVGETKSSKQAVQSAEVPVVEQLAPVAKLKTIEEVALVEDAGPVEDDMSMQSSTAAVEAPLVQQMSIAAAESLMVQHGSAVVEDLTIVETRFNDGGRSVLLSKEDRDNLEKHLLRTLNDANAKATFCNEDQLMAEERLSGMSGQDIMNQESDPTGSSKIRGSAWKTDDDKEFKIDGAFDFGPKKKSVADLGEEVYDVSKFYWDSGWSQKVARSETFQNITLAVICANAVYIGVDADWNKAETPEEMAPPFLVCENLFCIFFSGELMIRFFAFKSKRDCLKDGWFKFDSVLVMLMVFETWIVPLALAIIGGGGSLPTAPLRMLRLLRLSRMTRLMRSLPELVTMVKGMKVASRAVGSSLLMLAMLVYVFAIIVHMLLKEEITVAQYFETVPRCMWTLLMDGALMDSTGTVLTGLIDLATFNTGLAVFIFMLFTLLSAMTVMNMLIGVLCEVVSAVAAAEKDEASIRLMKSTILLELKNFDDDGNGCISQEELQHVINDKHAIGVLRSLQVDVGYLRELQTMLFPDPQAEVAIESIMDLILMCRGDLPPTVKHMINGQAFTRWMISNALKVEHKLVQDKLNALCEHIENIITMQMHRLARHASAKTAGEHGVFSITHHSSDNGHNGTPSRNFDEL